MNKSRNITKTSRVDSREYVNIETGEYANSSKDNQLVIKEKTEYASIVRADGNYCTVGTSSLSLLLDIISNADMVNVLKMSLYLNTSYNTIYNSNNKPHTNESLKEYLGFSSRSKYYELIKRLTILGVICKADHIVNKKKTTVFLMNPFLFSKRKTFHQSLIDTFSRFQISQTKKQ